MESQMYKTKTINVTDEIGSFKKKKYACVECGGTSLKIKRNHPNLAICECKTCHYTWNMRFRENDPKIEAEKRAYMKKYGLEYVDQYDKTAPPEDQLPF